MKDDLQKSDSCGLKSERKKILTSSTCSLACLSTNLGAFCPMVVHLPSEKSILPYFSGPRGVAILDCDSHSQAGSTMDACIGNQYDVAIVNKVEPSHKVVDPIEQRVGLHLGFALLLGQLIEYDIISIIGQI